MRLRHLVLIGYVAAALAFGCSGHSTVYEIITIHDGAAPASGGTGATSATGGSPVSSAGSPASSAGLSAGGDSGAAPQAGAANGSGGAGDSAGASDLGGVGGTAGVADSGAAGEAAGGVACGALIPNNPADCHATTACGPAASVVDQNNVPTPANPCLVGTCNAAGIPGTAPATAATPCSAAGGGILCDGAGKCVPCLHGSDCQSGQVCSAANQCVAGACTDLDCGGSCPPCPTGKKCLADADCISFACDAASLLCITPQCQDHRQDGVETDADCGGGFCPGCVLGKGCLVDEDCASLACDALKLICISNRCLDHRTDGEETGIDCGGSVCNSCFPGQGCKTNLDCQSGHFCNAGKVCQ